MLENSHTLKNIHVHVPFTNIPHMFAVHSIFHSPEIKLL